MRLTGKTIGILLGKDDLQSAGAPWVDAPAFRDGNRVRGRVAEDIPDDCRERIHTLPQAS